MIHETMTMTGSEGVKVIDMNCSTHCAPLDNWLRDWYRNLRKSDRLSRFPEILSFQTQSRARLTWSILAAATETSPFHLPKIRFTDWCCPCSSCCRCGSSRLGYRPSRFFIRAIWARNRFWVDMRHAWLEWRWQWERDQCHSKPTNAQAMGCGPRGGWQ